MNPRERQEIWEEANLAPWAVRAGKSRGRKVAELPDSVRTAFQRDRDRVVHSKAFRRLKHKTQVFIDPEEDHFRTRLTHTLEVTQIARTLARALQLNEDLTEAIALSHDLGHPPFGHAGEEALDEVLRDYVPGANFKHFDQSMRVVQVLERTDTRVGLNLTWEVLDGIAHHSKGRRDLKDADAEVSTTLEGQAMRIADRIAYVNHDLDDAVRAGVLNMDDIPTDILQPLGASHSDRITTMVEDIVDQSEGRPIVTMSTHIADATDRLKDYLFEHVYVSANRAASELDRARRAVKELFRFYMDHPEMIPGEPVRASNDVEALARQVTDYVAGMTDRFATAQFIRHFAPRGLRPKTQHSL